MCDYARLFREPPLRMINTNKEKLVEDKHIVRYNLLFGTSPDQPQQRHYRCEFYYEYTGDIHTGDGVYYTYDTAEFWDLYVNGRLDRFGCEVNTGPDGHMIDYYRSLEDFLRMDLLEDVEECSSDGSNLFLERCEQWKMHPNEERDEEYRWITTNMDLIITHTLHALRTNVIQLPRPCNEWHVINPYPHGRLIKENDEYVIRNNAWCS